MNTPHDIATRQAQRLNGMIAPDAVTSNAATRSRAFAGYVAYTRPQPSMLRRVIDTGVRIVSGVLILAVIFTVAILSFTAR